MKSHTVDKRDGGSQSGSNFKDPNEVCNLLIPQSGETHEPRKKSAQSYSPVHRPFVRQGKPGRRSNTGKGSLSLRQGKWIGRWRVYENGKARERSLFLQLQNGRTDFVPDVAARREHLFRRHPAPPVAPHRS